jgi:hypothetical protein
MKDCEGEMPPGMGSRVAISILVVFGWLIFLVVWLFFYSSTFTLLENLGIVIVAFLVGLAILAASWASWGLKYGKQAERWGKRMERWGNEMEQHWKDGSDSTTQAVRQGTRAPQAKAPARKRPRKK